MSDSIPFTGIERGTPASPDHVALSDGTAPWPFDRSEDSGAGVEVPLTGLLAGLPGGPWPEPAQQALVLPMRRPGQQQLAGFVVAGASPRRPLDDGYRGFLGLVAQQAATAVGNAQAYEQERRRAEALAEIDRAKTSFFTSVSHEFRTPLTLMLGPLEELTRALEGDAQRELAGTARRNAERLLKLVNTLLDFARVEGGRANATFEPTDLSAVTIDLASSFRSACERAGLALVVDCPPLPEPVYVDREQWEKIVLNLLSNAFKFTFDGEIDVRLRASADACAAVLSVQDTGTGIAAAEMPKLFGRFQRIEGSRGRSFEGSGIGLALVQELVKLHGGRIEAASEEGRGTTFTVHIPLGHAHLPAGQVRRAGSARDISVQTGAFVGEALQWLSVDAAAEAPDGGPGFGDPDAGDAVSLANPPAEAARILVADDNADMRHYLARLLGARYVVQTAGDGEAALALALAAPPDLVLADVMMPRLDGFGLIARLRADPRTRTLPVIVLSARAGEEARVEGLAAGADDYLVKPFSGRELLARVAAHLAAARVRRDAARSVREIDMRFRALVTATADVVYRMNPDWTQMRHLIGQEFIEDTLEPSTTWLQRYIPPEEQPRVEAAIAEAVSTKNVFQLEHRVYRVDGSIGWTFSRAIPILGEDGELVEWFGAATDVTPRMAAEEALREADRRKDEFLATLAHKLRNPLAPIRNAVYLMDTSGAYDAGVRAMLERQVGHMVRLVDDLMEASRISQGKLTLQREVIDLADVLRTAVETAKPLIDGALHTLTIDLPHEPLPVQGDAVRLAQVFGNLLNNAARYTEDGGRIELGARREADEICVTVADDGIGIAPEQLPRLFEIFAQPGDGHARSRGGLGIGLALVKRLVQMHGGTVQASSPGVGRGSVFTVRLPLAATAPAAVDAPATLPMLNQRRVLVVDDNRDAADSMGTLLRYLGAEVRVEHSGPAALATAFSWQPAVVLLDLGMPGMDGFEVSRRLRADRRFTGLKLIALTGWGQEEDRRRTRAAGFDHHLIKPVDISVLQTMLSTLSRGIAADEQRPSPMSGREE